MTKQSDHGSETPRAGEAPAARYVGVAGRRLRVPASRSLRLGAGGALVVGGVLGFLPVLGFWMLPLGLLVLSVDLPQVRRWRRRLDVRVGRWRNGRQDAPAARAVEQHPASRIVGGRDNPRCEDGVMSRNRRKKQPDAAPKRVEEELRAHFEATDKTHAGKPPRQTRGLGEIQRAPRRAMRETPKPENGGER